MAIKTLDPAYNTSINQKFRERRFKFFIELLERVKKTAGPIRILDIGGTEIYWTRMNYDGLDKLEVTMLNLKYEEPVKRSNFKGVIGDARDLSQYKEGEFDIVFSNSVIEHLFTRENQQKMANEIRRVGKYYYVQTPNYYFPIEPHWVFPLFQFMPFSWKLYLTVNYNLGHSIATHNKKEATDRINEITLLTEKEMKGFFPDGKVWREYFFGLVKSVTLYRFPEK